MYYVIINNCRFLFYLKKNNLYFFFKKKKRVFYFSFLKKTLQICHFWDQVHKGPKSLGRASFRCDFTRDGKNPFSPFLPLLHPKPHLLVTFGTTILTPYSMACNTPGGITPLIAGISLKIHEKLTSLPTLCSKCSRSIKGDDTKSAF